MAKNVLKWSALVFGLLAGLFFWNGVNPGWKHPETGQAQALPGLEADEPSPQNECRVLAFNLAKLGFHSGGFDFAEDFEVRNRLEQAAELIRDSKADIVCLSEVVFSGGPSGVNQVQELAAATGLEHWAYGDNYRFGFSFYGIRAGNAILSRYPLEPRFVQELPGSAPFWNPTNRRRLLLCDAVVNGLPLRIGSVRNDSFDLENNRLQSRDILDGLNAENVLLAGDFNAEPGDTSMQMFKSSGLFCGGFEGAITLPGEERRIDYVLGPRAWTLIEQEVVENLISDHSAVLARFWLP